MSKPKQAERRTPKVHTTSKSAKGRGGTKDAAVGKDQVVAKQKKVGPAALNKLIKQKGDRLDIRLTSEQKGWLKEAADIVGESLTSYILSTALRDALQLIRERSVITLSERDWNRLEEIASDESGPNEYLLKAAERYCREVSQDVSGSA
jgi:uncharacterized protein (DUF1778 family)